MNIAEFLAEEAVLTDLKATDSRGVLRELAAPVLKAHPELEKYDIVAALCRREELGSTAVGEGVALPHCKTPGLSEIALAVGRSRTGIDFGQPPGDELCRIFFLILAPENEAGHHLRVLAQIARRVKDPGFRSELLLADNRKEMWQVLTTP